MSGMCEIGMAEMVEGGTRPGVGGSWSWVIGWWSMNSSTSFVSSSRSCWGCQSTSDSMTTVTHSLVSPMTTLMGFSNPPLGLTSPEEMRFLITLSSRFLRVVLPTCGGPVNRHLRDLCLIFLWWRYFSSNFFSWTLASVFMKKEGDTWRMRGWGKRWRERGSDKVVECLSPA